MKTTVEEVISILKDLGDSEKVIYKEHKFGIIAQNSLGIYHKDLKLIAKEIKKDSELGIALFDTGIYEARLLCSKIFHPDDLTGKLMEHWVVTFDNWEICDSFCMGLFAKSQFAVPKAIEWTKKEKEFEKRAGFAIIAAYCMADKKEVNDVFETFLTLIKKEANDDRLYVKKAVSWALRNIGKRNIDLNKKAITCAKEVLKMDTKAARWIAKDALRELEKEGVRMSDYPRDLYRKKSK